MSKLDAQTLAQDLAWFVQGMAAKFDVPVSAIEANVIIHDDAQGESVSAGCKAAG